MKAVFLHLGLLVGIIFRITPLAAQESTKQGVNIAIVDDRTKVDYEEKISPLVSEYALKCQDCSFENISPYDSKGEFAIKDLEKKIQSLDARYQIIVFLFNYKYNDELLKISEIVRAGLVKGRVVIAAAGTPKKGDASGPLNQTVFGKIPDVIIIGEMFEKDRLFPTSFYGPEMLTSVQLNKNDVFGAGVLLMSYFVAKNYKMQSHWVTHLRERKLKSKRIWPTPEELVGIK